MKASRATVALAAASLVVLAGCANDGSVTEPPVPPAAQEPAEESSTPQAEPTTPQPPEPSEDPPGTTQDEPSAEPSEDAGDGPTDDASEEPGDDATGADEPEATTGVTAFGETATSATGLRITVDAPEEYTPDETAAGGEEYERHVRFTVRVENAGDEPYEQYLITDLESAGDPGDQVFDVANNLNGTPSGTIRPGDDLQFDLGWGLEDPEDVRVVVTVTFDEEPLVFTASGD